MKYTLTLAAIAAIATAQTIADLPTCSITCVANGVTGVGCGLTDFACSCQKAAELTPLVTPCVQEACTDPAEQAKVITVLEGICANAGFPIDIPEPGTGSSSSAPPPAESTPAPPAESTPAPPAESTPAPPAESTPAETPAESSAAPTPSGTDVVISDPTAAPTGAGSSYPVPSGKPEESCVVHTSTVTVSKGKPGASSPPYPTGPPSKPSGPAPSGTGTGSYPSPPEFTGAASSFKVPAGIAGVVGLAAFML